MIVPLIPGGPQTGRPSGPDPPTPWMLQLFRRSMEANSGFGYTVVRITTLRPRRAQSPKLTLQSLLPGGIRAGTRLRTSPAPMNTVLIPVVVSAHGREPFFLALMPELMSLRPA